MKSLVHWYFKALETIMVLCLAAMCIMVFGNVVLRHVFDSGINISEELARFMFIWLTFLGAIVAMREGGHLGMDMVVTRLPPKARRVALTLGQALVVVCCAVLLWGLIRQHDINVANIGLVTGMSLGIVYSVAYVCAVSIGVMAFVNMVRLMRGTGPDQPLVSDHT
ncbi:MAG: TRAP transporter small permease [Comamonadaceae bacterium]|nr:TRAP transporter small permease [Comamonadaceae bacterium]